MYKSKMRAVAIYTMLAFLVISLNFWIQDNRKKKAFTDKVPVLLSFLY